MPTPENQVIVINGTQIAPTTYRDQRVVTYEMVAQVHGVEVDTVRRNYSRNAARFLEGKHTHIVKDKELQELKDSGTISPRVPELRVFTEQGYYLLVKPMTDDVSWQVQSQMADVYFAVQHGSILPVLRDHNKAALIQALIDIDRIESEQIEIKRQLAETNERTLFLLQSMLYTTVREYVYMQELTRQLPAGTAQQAYGRYLSGYCREKGIPTRKIPTDNNFTETSYPVHALQSTLQGWLARYNGQTKFVDDCKRGGA